MKSDVKRLFLLGGRDLEMEEIRKLLVENGCQKYEQGSEGDCFYADRELEWGAKLSDYKDLLDFDGKIYGIELSKDIKAPKNYRAIDHHNSSWCRPSALEQVAELLGVELTRWQQLVAANDRGYIPALKQMGATTEEIKQIREADMKAQGVTEEELKKAPKELAKAQKNSSGIWLLETDFEHFSPLSDLLYEQEKLPAIIYNPSRKELTYYGKKNIFKLVETFKKAVNAQDAYYGGNPPGYFGLTPEYFKDHSIEEALETISQTLQSDPIHSYHIFMFPFRIEDFKRHNFITEEIEHEKLRTDHWESEPFTIKTPQDYNEYVYFHKYVRDELYQPKTFDSNQTSRYYERKDLDGATWTMKIKDETFKLDLDGVALRLFRTGIGILTINLINRQTDDDEKILLINEFGRRIYPQFLADSDGCDYAYETKNAFLPQSVSINLADGKLLAKEDFCYTELPTTEEAPKIGEHIRKLLGNTLANLADLADHTNLADPVIDDRMYTLCYINKDGRSLGLDKKGYLNEECASNFWYRYIFLDGSEITCHSPEMKKELIQKATYDRWMNHPWGCSLYGITRYSFMLYSSYDLLHTHLRTMYYQMATLALAQRASILRYANTAERWQGTARLTKVCRALLRLHRLQKPPPLPRGHSPGAGD